jgi:hypothetical protein
MFLSLGDESAAVRTLGVTVQSLMQYKGVNMNDISGAEGNAVKVDFRRNRLLQPGAYMAA